MYDLSNITPCKTDDDNVFYPGQLNVDANGNKLITANSTPEDYIKSFKDVSKKHGVINILDLKVKYNNSGFGKEELNPHHTQSNPLSGGNYYSAPDRTAYFKKIMPLLEKEDEDSDFNPLLAEPEEEITIKHLLPDLNPFATVGDPRYTLGCAMQQIYQEFYPRILACQEIADAQGAGIKDDCICSEDGQQIRKASQVAIFAANRTITDYTSGLKKPCLPTTDEISAFFDAKINEAREAHTMSFVRYIKLCYLSNPQWKADPVILKNPAFFFVKLYKTLVGETKPSEAKFLRYYYDQADRVAELLGVELIKTDTILATENLKDITEQLKSVPKDFYSLIKEGRRLTPTAFFEIEAAKEFAQPIPDYTTMPCPSGVY